MRDRKQVPLNEVELKAQMSKEEADDEDKQGVPQRPKGDEPALKFNRNFSNAEILKIMEDTLQGKKLLSAPGAQGTKSTRAHGSSNPEYTASMQIVIDLRYLPSTNFAWPFASADSTSSKFRR
jgi:hypothetical protein